MLRISLLALFFISSTPVVYAQCSHDQIGAVYTMVEEDIHIQGKQKQTNQMVLWRNGQQIAHQYPKLHITELWEKNSNGQIRLVKNFDEHKRGIEYEPNEIQMKHNIESWQKKKLLVSQSLIKSMKLNKTQKEDCDRTQIYTKNTKLEQLNLSWLPEQQLLKSFEIKTPKKRIYWKLESIITDKKQVKQLFSNLEDYFMTDYADVGDNESDPFLMKMINLGFVEHGASGVYDQNGHKFNGGHNH